MDNGLLTDVKKNIRKDPEKIVDLLKDKHEEEHIRKAINVHKDDGVRNHPIEAIAAKEFSEKLSAGLISQQFISILLSTLNASMFMIGSVVGLKALLESLLSSFMQELTSVRTLKKWTIVIMSIVFGIIIALSGAALYWNNLPLFIVLIIATSIGIVILGDSYQVMFKRFIKPEDRGFLLSRLPQFGLIMAVLGLMFGAYLLTKELFFTLFLIAALLFTFSNLFLIYIYKPATNEMNTTITGIIQEIWKKTVGNAKKLFSNKIVIILFIASSITAVVQTLGNAYFGLFIFKSFGGYFNVALIFTIAVLTTLISPKIARMLGKKYGTIPQLVFGTLLVALLPLAYWYNPFLTSLSAATMIGIIGSAIIGLATGLLIRNELESDVQRMYYTSFPILIAIPYIIAIPLGSYAANVVGLKTLFFYLSLILIIIVAPLYFSLLFMVKKRVV